MGIQKTGVERTCRDDCQCHNGKFPASRVRQWRPYPHSNATGGPVCKHVASPQLLILCDKIFQLSMAWLPWHIKQHRVNITERLYSGNCVWRSQFFNHSAPLPPGGHGTHYPTRSGPGTLSVPTPAREACATFHWPETYRKQRITNKPTPQSETTPSRHASVSRRPGPDHCEVAILEQL